MVGDVQHPLIAHCVFVLGPPTAPGPLESVNYQPDILSILLSWDLPQRGRGYITTVTLEYYNSEGVKLGTESVGEGRKSYRCSAYCIHIHMYLHGHANDTVLAE